MNATVKIARATKNLKKPEIQKPPLTIAEKSRMALSLSLNGAVLVHSFQKNVLGPDLDINVMIERLVDTCTDVKGDDLRKLEAKPSHGAPNHLHQRGPPGSGSGAHAPL